MPSRKLSVFSAKSQQKVHDELQRSFMEKEAYIHKLEALLQEHNIEIPAELHLFLASQKPPIYLKDGTEEELKAHLEAQLKLMRDNDIHIEFQDLTFKVSVPSKRTIPSVGTALKSMICFWTNCEPQKEVHIISKLTGRIRSRVMTLLIGPPGSGKSVLMKALGGRLVKSNGTLEGHVYYDGDSIQSGKFLPPKIANYVEQGDTLEATLTVEETLQFAWNAATGGHHSYGRAKDEEAAKILDQEDGTYSFVKNMLTGLGLNGCKDTLVGNAMIRGVSGGQKRRVTVGEIMVCPRPIHLLDSISNGLDAATTFDIVRAVKQVNVHLGTTVLMSLLQPAPDVYNLFDEIIVLSEGHIIYQGPRTQIMHYFAVLGYTCPDHVDEADFLQELPTPDGSRFLKDVNQVHNTTILAKAWKTSHLYQELLSDMRHLILSQKIHDVEAGHGQHDHIKPRNWPEDTRESNPHGFWYSLKLNLQREYKIFIRNKSFLISRLSQSLLVGAITGSLFSNINTNDIMTMNGFLFNCVLFGAVNNFAIIPMVYEQKAVFYKHADALLYPTSVFALTQGITLFPLHLMETILYITITYWSAGLSDDIHGSRYATFVVFAFFFTLVIGQLCRLIAAVVPDQRNALPVAGILIVIMVLFSGFIQPKALISDGWIWFYWLNPMSWVLKGVSLNEFKSPKYDFLTCVDTACTEMTRFGDLVLEQYGNPTTKAYIGYSFLVLIAEYLLLFFATFLALKYLRTVGSPPPPNWAIDPELTTTDNNSNAIPCTISQQVVIPAKPSQIIGNEANANETNANAIENGTDTNNANNVSEDVPIELPFDEVSFAFKEISYTVTLPNGEDVELLHEVNGYFEPGTMTALMGSSGAGKTTLLDVLAGRKNTGVVKGNMFLNGIPKHDGYFRKIMGYVEQFDSLPQKSTAREAIAFSAALRLNASITTNQREAWVNAVLDMLDLYPLENELIGATEDGGMSFEQRKRVSIGVELAANPSILFLDEPTTGLDSRAAQALIRNIRRIAASGRSIVCTIHQPSTAIFNAFDLLLLLRRGGQTVFFGNLGVEASDLVTYFESAPGVMQLPLNMNPAIWMLDIIGAGTSTATATTGNASIMEIDYYQYYLQSSLYQYNAMHLQALITPNEGSKRLQEELLKTPSQQDEEYTTSSYTQFVWLMWRIAMTYWRSPNYSIARIFVNILLALVFGSAYPKQEYSTYIAVVSRASVIYITTFFCGVLALITVIPVMTAERLVFYREQQSSMYRVSLYTLTTILIEIPYVILTALAFTLPFFYIVGFDNVGAKGEKFFWYWCFQSLWQGLLVFLGQFFVVLTPTEVTTQVLAGLFLTIFSLFCGFLIAEASFPTFWLFMYWLNPLHYCLEGLITAMFHGDNTPITMMNQVIVTAEVYIRDYQYDTWNFGHIGLDILAMCIYMIVIIVGKYLCLTYLRHDKR